MENNDCILIFKEKAVQQLKNKNFTNDQRLPFYRELTKIAQNFVKTLHDENEKNTVLNYVKNFIISITRDETLTPQKALQSFKEDVTKHKQLIAEKRKTIKLKNEQQNLNQKLIDAISSGNIKTVENYIQNGADVNAQDKYGNTPLIHAIGNKQYKLAKLLIEKGADVDTQDKHGYTPLIWGIYYEQPKITKLLIEKGVDMNVQDKHCNNALIYAIEK